MKVLALISLMNWFSTTNSLPTQSSDQIKSEEGQVCTYTITSSSCTVSVTSSNCADARRAAQAAYAECN
jgi:hypothetical protein